MEGVKIKTNFYTKNKEIVIVELGGYIDQTNSRQVEKVINDIVKTEKLKIIFDLKDLVYMSSAGWGIFVGEIKRLRDMGGDIRIAAMSPEVYEVFQMLEFYHIIEDYLSVQEAVDSFLEEIYENQNSSEVVEADNPSIDELLQDSGLGSSSIVEDQNDEIAFDEKSTEPSIQIRKRAPTPREEDDDQTDFNPVTTEISIDIKKLPASEKVKKVVANYPLLNIFQIRKMLSHEKFGYTKIGLFKLYRMLKDMNLGNKKDRYRYYRST